MFALVITLIVVGIILWLINNYITMDAKIKMILNIVVVICVLVYVLSAFGVLHHANDVPVPQIR